VFAAAILTSGQSQLMLLLWPVLLLLIGLFLIARVFSSGGKKQPSAVPIESLTPSPDSESAEEEAPAKIQLPDAMQPHPVSEPEPVEPLDLEIIEPEIIEE
jgi:hypothetical protein